MEVNRIFTFSNVMLQAFKYVTVPFKKYIYILKLLCIKMYS